MIGRVVGHVEEAEKRQKDHAALLSRLEVVLRKIYRRYNPSKLQDSDGNDTGNIAAIISTYAGIEEGSNAAAGGVDDSGGGSSSSITGVTDLFTKLGAKYEQDFTRFLPFVLTGTGPIPQTEAEEQQRRQRLSITLNEIYLLYNPSKMVDVPVLVKQFLGREASLLHSLEEKYGESFSSFLPYIMAAGEREAAPMPRLRVPLAVQQIRGERLYRCLRSIYRVHNPLKLQPQEHQGQGQGQGDDDECSSPFLSELVSRFVGREEALLRQLGKKYSIDSEGIERFVRYASFLPFPSLIYSPSLSLSASLCLYPLSLLLYSAF